jgi:hypothetical protein
VATDAHRDRDAQYREIVSAPELSARIARSKATA